MAGRNSEDKIRCSFCGKSQDQVRKLIAGPNGAYICDECVDICAEIIEEEFEDEEISGKGKEDLEEINLIKPEEMKKFLIALGLVVALTACGGGDDNTAPEEDTGTETPAGDEEAIMLF